MKDTFDITILVEGEDTKELVKEEDTKEKETPELSLSEQETSFLTIMRGIDFSFKKIYDLLKDVYIDEIGREHYPNFMKKSDKGNILVKNLKKLLLTYCDELVKFSFDPTNDGVNLNRFQGYREKIKDAWAREIAYVFSIDNLLRENPLRQEGGKEALDRFCNTKAKQYLAVLLSYREQEGARREGREERWRRTKRYYMDAQSRGKPCLNHLDQRVIVSSLFELGSYTNTNGEEVQEEIFRSDISKFLDSQRYGKKIEELKKRK